MAAVSLRPMDCSNFSFKHVLGESRKDKWQIVEEVFTKRIAPLYGNQEEALKRIQNADDRKCRLLYDGDHPAGVVVYKSTASNEYGLKNYVEIKTLCLVDPEHDSGKGYGSELLHKARDHADEIHASGLYVTVRKSSEATKAFFQKKGFQFVKEFSRNDGSPECVFALRFNDKKPGKEQETKDSADSNPINTSAGAGAGAGAGSGAGVKRKREDDQEEPNKRARVGAGAGAGAGAGSGAVSDTPTYVNTRKQWFQTIPIKNPYFGQIQKGSKTVEGRIDNHPFNQLREGMLVDFKNGNQMCACKVVKIVRYKTFAEMLSTEGVHNCLPDVRTLQEAIDIYKNIPGYAEKAARFGVMAIRIKKI